MRIGIATLGTGAWPPNQAEQQWKEDAQLGHQKNRGEIVRPVLKLRS